MNPDLLNSVSNFLPEIVLVLAILLIPLNNVLFEGCRIQARVIGVSGIGVSLIFSVFQIYSAPARIFGAMSVIDPFSAFANIAISFSSFIIVLVTVKNETETSGNNERYIFIASLALGCMLMTSSVNLIMLFASIALMDTSLFFLMNFERSPESVRLPWVNFFIFSMAASALFLLGASILYGITGSLDYYSISAFLSNHPFNATTLALALLLILAAFASKALPLQFHLSVSKITGEVPLYIYGMILCPVVISAFIGAVRFFITAMHSTPQVNPGEFTFYSLFLHPSITMILYITGVITIAFSSIAVIYQTGLRRIIFFFAIGQSSVLVLAVAIFSKMCLPAAIALAISFCLTFPGLVYYLSKIESDYNTDNVIELSGTGNSDKWTFAGLLILLLSNAGIPVSVGFASRILVYNSMTWFSSFWMIILSALNTLIFAIVCFKIFRIIFLLEGSIMSKKAQNSRGTKLILLVIVLPAILLGFYFSPIVKAAEFFSRIYGIG